MSKCNRIEKGRRIKETFQQKCVRIEYVRCNKKNGKCYARNMKKHIWNYGGVRKKSSEARTVFPAISEISDEEE